MFNKKMDYPTYLFVIKYADQVRKHIEPEEDKTEKTWFEST